jgi:mersacidin/lichenicidin family type 2 lantibiotic
MDASDQQVAKDTIVRAWQDEEFRASLPEELRREIPARPLDGTGAVLSDEQLETAAGAATPGVLVGVKAVSAGAKVATGAKWLGIGAAGGAVAKAGGDAYDAIKPY